LDPSLPSVSIIVPTRDEVRTIEACLSAVLGQAYPADRLELLVVDGRSTDGTRELVAALATRDGRVSLIDNPERITPVAFNRGIRAAKGEVIGVMSAHGVPAADYVGRAVEQLSATGAWCVGGRIDRVATTPVGRAIAAATSSPFGVGDATHNYQTSPGWVETAFPGMWPRWVFDQVGPFDPELVRNQDDEFSYRIREAGGRIWYDPGIVIAYVPRGSYRTLFSQYRQYAYWKVRVFQKHPGAARPRHLVPAAWVAALAGGVLLTPLSPAAILLTITAGGAYAGVMIVAALRLGSDDVRPKDALQALATLHLAYGVGFWQGLARFGLRWFRDRRGTRDRLTVDG
jgi:succinoglycan biosynthesis protein ExoA